MTGLVHPELLTDGVIELRRWRKTDVAGVHAARGGSTGEARAWVRQQQARRSTVGVSCAVAPSGQDAVGYVGLIKRPRVEMGVVVALADGDLVFKAHESVVGIGYWTAPEAQGKGLATRAVVLLSHWALQSAGVIRVEALLDLHNIASRRAIPRCCVWG